MIVALLWINGIGFLGFGVAGLLFPDVITGLTGLVAQGGDAPTEIRAQYGGIFLAIGAFGVLGAVRASARELVLTLMLLVYVGLAIGRLVGVALDEGPLGSYTYGAMGFEIVMSLVLGVLWFTKPQAE